MVKSPKGNFYEKFIDIGLGNKFSVCHPKHEKQEQIQESDVKLRSFFKTRQHSEKGIDCGMRETIEIIYLI